MVHKGEVLRKLIREKKTTGGKVAEHLGINRSYLSTLFNDPNLKDEYIDKACDFLGVDRDEYFSEDSEQNSYINKYIEAMERLTNLQADNIELMKENAHLKEELEQYRSKYGVLNNA